MSKRPEVGKWFFLFRWGMTIDFYDPLMRRLEFGVFKMTSRPPEGTKLTKKYYKGFMRSYFVRLLIARDK